MKTYTINGKEYSEFDINKRCAELMGLIVQSQFKERCGFTKDFHERYPNTIWAAKVDERGDQSDAWEQMVFTRCPENTWPIIEKCWDKLTGFVFTEDDYITRWNLLINRHNCTKLVAACICFIEVNS